MRGTVWKRAARWTAMIVRQPTAHEFRLDFSAFAFAQVQINIGRYFNPGDRRNSKYTQHDKISALNKPVAVLTTTTDLGR